MIVGIKSIKIEGTDDPFKIGAFAFSYTNDFDRSLLDDLIAQANRQAGTVNSGAANQGATSRPLAIKIVDSFAGLLAEYCWKYFINLIAIDVVVTETQMVTARTQIDLRVLKNNKSIEIRSSIVRNGILFAITHPEYAFNLIGPYENEYKPHEGQKSYYLGALLDFSGEKKDFLDFVRATNKESKLKVWLVAGATRDMMIKDGVEKGMAAGDTAAGNSKYKTMKVTNSLDAIAVAKLIISESN